MLRVVLHTEPFPLLILSCCAPTAAHPEEEKTIFDHKIKEALAENPRATPSGVAPANQTKERAETKSEKLMNFAHFCEFWRFSLGKQSRSTSNFCSRMPPKKVQELAFLWFGLPA